MRRVRTVCLVALAAVAGVLIVVSAAWAIDLRIAGDRVARNTQLAGRKIGGLTPAQLHVQVAAVATKYRTAPVQIDASGGGFTTNASDLGLTLDAPATEQAARKVGHTGAVPGRVVAWLRSFVQPRVAKVHVAVDEAAVHRVVAAKDPGPRTPPVEPSLKAKSNGTGFSVVEGKPGKGIDPRDVIDALPTAAASGGPVRVKVDRGEVPPRYTKSDADAVRKVAERATAKPLRVGAASATATVPVATLRKWVRVEPGDNGLELTIDEKQSAGDLGRLLAKAATPPTQTTFVVNGGVPVAKPGSPGTACCAAGAPGIVRDALFGDDRPAEPVMLPLKAVQPDVPASKIGELGVKEQVSTFTTRYAAGQPRVTNIHRIADIVKGTLILPGSTFSLNGRVGQRTTAKGFVSDHQINDQGEFDEAIGGGISQFATTAFNAAFFAGLDYGEYQSHTIYISRYPYGREATVSWQHPDLQIKNTTPYGVVIWASYTDTSLTVSLYSTKYLDSVTQSNQTKATFGPDCTRVTTERTRKYLDGRTVVDKVYATYQPKEGVKCR
jgi:vancomycin resistance protein YoaR